MKRILFIAFLTMALTAVVNAQETLKLLNVQETTQGVGVYPCGDRHEAMVQFVTNEPFGLTFESSHDRPDQMRVTLDSIAGRKTYSLVFVTQEPGKDFSNRRLTIRVPGFQDYRIPLPLKDKQLFEYTVSDPYSVLRSPFFNYLEKAQESFNNSEYQKAKDNYELCRYCPEYLNDTANILQHIQLCDSMLIWYNQAIEADHFFRYHEAVTAYSKLLIYDGNEKLRQSMYNAQRNFDRDCEAMLNIGLKEMEAGNLERADQMLNQVIDNGCTRYAKMASDNLEIVHKAKLRRDSHSRTFIAEHSPTYKSWGFTFGDFYENKGYGWYLSLMANGHILDFIEGAEVKGTYDKVTEKFTYKDEMKQDKESSKEYPNKMKYNVNFALGSNWHIWEPIYVHAGVGYNLGAIDLFDKELVNEAIKKNKNFNKDCTSTQFFHGVAPEVGVVLKYYRAALKLTYQYTIWTNKGDFKDFCNDHVNGIKLGIGFCW
jgi:hypothetical protein